MGSFDFKIYQYRVDYDRANSDKDYGEKLSKRLFRELKPEDVSTFTLVEYEIVYEGKISIDGNYLNALSALFDKFNIDHPQGYMGRSMSVSDVVQINDKYYYCQPFEWTEVNIRDKASVRPGTKFKIASHVKDAYLLLWLGKQKDWQNTVFTVKSFSPPSEENMVWIDGFADGLSIDDIDIIEF